ncbi:amidohydrolase 2 [Coniochaeta sp. PMI_546]|nr:amidohydrolase 2 [Coniochaeta sp. PMI_546]
MPPTHPILDSHIHLYPASELSSLAWCDPSHPLASQKSVSDYRTATRNQVSGFIFLETDRRNAQSQSWTDPLAEIAWLRRIVTDSPREGEGHAAGDGALCRAIVPWAPVDLGREKVVFILNHLCKPDLGIVNTTSDPSFVAWRTAMFTLSKCSRTYMKLSGAFSEMPEHLTSRSANEIFEILYPWLAVVLAAFGPGRIMFASDWPVCTVGGGEDAWDKWRLVVERMCYMASLSEEDQEMIWSGTARRAYGIE